MAILASLRGLTLFSSLPSTPPPPNEHPPSSSSSPSPPIPIPRYPPSLKSQRRETPNSAQNPPKPRRNPALKTVHRRSNYYKPVRDGVIAADGDRAVVVGESGVSYLLPGAPFEFQYSYSETPKAKPLAIREPAFLPFAPPTMPRPWTGKAPLKSAKEKKRNRKIPLLDSFLPPPAGAEGVKQVEMPGPFPFGKYPKVRKTREEILGEPLKKLEIKMLIRPHLSSNRQVNLGRDGLTHNMLELIHSHWRRTPVCKIRCKGVPTVDMDNVCHHIEEKTGGKIIHRAGGAVYLFRGRNYNYAARPQYPLMLWKPAAPVYPKLIQEAPGGLTKEEADELRMKGKKLLPICKLGHGFNKSMPWVGCESGFRDRCTKWMRIQLFYKLTPIFSQVFFLLYEYLFIDICLWTIAKNGVYITLVRDVRHAFEGSPLVKIDCKGMHASDYKKLGAKLKELVPCVLLSFDDEQILMWRGSDWKSMYRDISLPSNPLDDFVPDLDSSGEGNGDGGNPDIQTARTSPKMLSLWKRALESNKAMLLDEINLGPDALLKKVEEFEGISQATEHSYPALIVSGEDGISSSMAKFDELPRNDDDDDDDFVDDYDEENDDVYYDSDSSLPLGALPIDVIANKLIQD